MKGIVVEINNKDAVILAEDGLFKRIENRNYEIGQTLKLASGQKPGLRQFVLKPVISTKLLIGAARIAAVVAIGTIGAFAWHTPTSYISLDVNPSVEYSVNMFDRILEARAVNEDGEEILKDLQLKNKKIEEGLKETLDELIAEGYLADDPDSGIVIAASNEKPKEAEKMAMELKSEVQTYLETRKDVTVQVDAGAASPQKVKEAKSLGVTPGKLHLVEKLQASTTGAIEMEQWLAKPVKEINKEIKKNWETAGKKAFDGTKAFGKERQKNNADWKRDRDEDLGRDWNRDWGESWALYRKQPEKAGAEKTGGDKGRDQGGAAWDKGLHQTWSRNQDKGKDEKDWDETRDRNKDRKQEQKQDKDQKWEQRQNKEQKQKDEKWEQKQNEDRSPDGNKERKQDQDRGRNQNQTKNQDQTTPGGIENGKPGNRSGGPEESGRWTEGEDGKNDGKRSGPKKSKD